MLKYYAFSPKFGGSELAWWFKRDNQFVSMLGMNLGFFGFCRILNKALNQKTHILWVLGLHFASGHAIGKKGARP